MRIAFLWRLGAVPLLIVVVGCLLAPTAWAAIPLGGGAGIVVDGTYCTLTTIGHDNTGELVGFTAAQCGGPGSPVVAEGTDGTVGTVVAANGNLHYAVIKFDPAKVTPISDFAGFAITGIGPDPGSSQPVCTQGGATGFNCGLTTIAGVIPGRIKAMMPAWQLGDDGAPITVDGQLAGMTFRAVVVGNLLYGPAFFPGGNANISVVLFSAILDDVNTNGGPGAGFTPIAA